jgi:hypothetical protein
LHEGPQWGQQEAVRGFEVGKDGRADLPADALGLGRQRQEDVIRLAAEAGVLQLGDQQRRKFLPLPL